MVTGSDGDTPEFDDDETTFAQGRLPGRTYASKSFPLKRTNSSDDGHPARFICKVLDTDNETIVEQDGEEWLLRETDAGRYQFKVLVAREAGNVKQLWIQRVPAEGKGGSVKNLLSLTQPEIGRLIDFIKLLDHIPADGETSVRVDDALLDDILSDDSSVAAIYRRDPERVRAVVAADEQATDIVALAARRNVVARFRQMLTDDALFDRLIALEGSGSPERVWQRFFDKNPWLLGVSLSAQLLTSWNDERLEQVVVGSSITGPGKRTDVLMRTSGRIRSMVFAEIKTHRTDLLGKEYRGGCWAPSTELVGGVAQAQGTVHLAVAEIGDRISSLDDDGAELPNDLTYLIRPRSILIAGNLDQLHGAGGGHHPDKVRSYELYRRSVWEPDVVTFDEILARAEGVIEIAAERQ